MYTLGINAAYHDSAACLIRDGIVVAAAEEERFTRIKHGKRPVPFSAYELPFHAIDYCLAEADINLTDVEHVAYSYNPYLILREHHNPTSIPLPLEPSAGEGNGGWESPWEPLFLSHVVNSRRHLSSGAPHHLKRRFRGATPDGPYRYHFVDHHLAHAASAFLPSPFPEAAVLTLDGRGERATTASWIGRGNDLQLLRQVDVPHSLGLLYERVTEYLGFLHSSDEYKVMALASFGKPALAPQLREAVHVASDGIYTVGEINLQSLAGPPRQRGEPFSQEHYDLAASLQQVLEETVLALARTLHEQTGCENLCLAGGVALNCVMNARLRDAGLFRDVWAQPAAGDAGTALGAAIWIDARERNSSTRAYQMDNAFLGPHFSDAEIEDFLRWSKTPYRPLRDIAGQTADLLGQDKIVGWFQGRMEFGPRALGARSILASPIHAGMQARLNDIKDREDFRPVAPVVLEEEAASWFRGANRSPFMLFVYDVLPDRADQIPAVRHVDGTARIQTINRDQNKRYYDLVKAFADRTGVPILVNTSFNTRGEPIVCTPRDALECFWTSPLDALVIGSFLIEKGTARA